MVNLFRLIPFLLLFISSASFALIQPVPRYEARLGPFAIGYGSSKTAACSAAFALFQNVMKDSYNPGAKQELTGTGDPNCSARAGGNAGWSMYQSGPVNQVDTQCPANAVDVGGGFGCMCHAEFEEKDGQCRPKNLCSEGEEEQGGACVPKKCKPEEIRVNGFCVSEPPCPDGETRVNGKCEPNKCPKAGTFASEYKVTSRTPTSFCENKCTISIKTFVEATKDGKVVDRVGMGFHTGNSCNTDTPPGDTTGGGGNNDGGGNNNSGGNNNGGGGTGGNTGGGTGGNTGGGGGGGGGSGGDKQPEKCTKPGGCTGTNGGTNNNGNAGAGEGTNTQGDGTCPAGKYKSGGKCYDKDKPEKDPDDDGACPKGYAKINGKCVPYEPPEDEEDDKPGTFGGACGAGFSCEGDVIQCSIAKEQHVRNCKLFDEKSAESMLYEQNKGKEGNQTTDLPGNETIDMQGRIDTSDALGFGSGGVQDLNITVAGHSVTLPLSLLNQYLSMLGNLLVAISFLIALRIVGRG